MTRLSLGFCLLAGCATAPATDDFLANVENVVTQDGPDRRALKQAFQTHGTTIAPSGQHSYSVLDKGIIVRMLPYDDSCVTIEALTERFGDTICDAPVRDSNATACGWIAGTAEVEQDWYADFNTSPSGEMCLESISVSWKGLQEPSAVDHVLCFIGFKCH